jgi:hypothetical protein
MPARLEWLLPRSNNKGQRRSACCTLRTFCRENFQNGRSVNECRLLRCRNICGLEVDPTHRGHGRNDGSLLGFWSLRPVGLTSSAFKR